MIAGTEMAASSLERSVGRMEQAAMKIGAAHATWAPSATARSAKDLVAHSAWSIGSLEKICRGTTFDVATTAEADVIQRDFEAQVPSMTEAVRLLAESRDSFLQYLSSLSEDDLGCAVRLPFDLGEVPRSVAIGFPAMHTESHVAQLEYLQTILGDREW